MPDSHGAFGVFEISIRAAFVGVCDIDGLIGVILPVGIPAGSSAPSASIGTIGRRSSLDPLSRRLVDTVGASDYNSRYEISRR